MAAISLLGITKRYRDHVAVDRLDLEVEAGEFMVLVGPSGCGKSTTLRLIAGLDDISEGRIVIGGRDVTHAEPHQRDIAMVFQSYALYPHMSVHRNMAFGLMRTTRLPKAEIDRRVHVAAERLRIGDLLARKPHELSGGQRQRVAIGRALVRQPQVFLFDEPLSNLDAKLRTHMRSELERLHAELGITVVYVTHDQVEAMTLGTRIGVMDRGRLQQVGTPMEVYRRPASRFVASFIGSPEMNFLPVPEGRGREWVVAHFGEHGLGQETMIGLRPEDWKVQSLPAADAPLSWTGTVARVERLGAEAHAQIALHQASLEPAPLHQSQVIVRVDGDAALAAGQVVTLVPALERVRVFGGGDGRALAGL